MIFALALTHHDVYIIDGVLTNVKQPTNLVRVCRQIHAETALFPYALNTFIVTKPLLGFMRDAFTISSSGGLYSFLEARTPAQIGVMTSVRRYRSSKRERSATEWLEIRRVLLGRS